MQVVHSRPCRPQLSGGRGEHQGTPTLRNTDHRRTGRPTSRGQSTLPPPHLKAVAHAPHGLPHVGQHEIAHHRRRHVPLVPNAGVRTGDAASGGKTSRTPKTSRTSRTSRTPRTSRTSRTSRASRTSRTSRTSNQKDWRHFFCGHEHPLRAPRTSTACRPGRKTTAPSSPSEPHWTA